MRSTTISIAEPCAQSWDSMTPQGAGRHCASCQKVVIDFARKTDAEILAILGAAAGGSTCGRFQASQLNRPLRQPVPARSGGWSTAVAATVALLLGRTALAPDARAQAPASQHPADGRHSPEPEFRQPGPIAKPGKVKLVVYGDTVIQQQVGGQVVDQQTGEGLPGVIVLLKGTTKGTSTDSSGHFTLLVSDEERHFPLMFQSIGYFPTEIPQPTGSAALHIVMIMSVQMLGGLSIVGYPIYTPRGVWSRLSSIPYRVSNLFR